MPSSASDFRRPTLGVIALVLLSVGFLVPVSPVVAGAVIRVGFVLASVWLAYPQVIGLLQRLPTIVPIIALAAMAVLAIRPKIFYVLAALAIVLVALGLAGKFFRKPER